MLTGSSPVPAADVLNGPSNSCRLLTAATSWTDQHNTLFLRPYFSPWPNFCIILQKSQVIIGSTDLKANHDILQVVEVVTDHEKYPRMLKVSTTGMPCLAHALHMLGK